MTKDETAEIGPPVCTVSGVYGIWSPAYTVQPGSVDKVDILRSGMQLGMQLRFSVCQRLRSSCTAGSFSAFKRAAQEAAWRYCAPRPRSASSAMRMPTSRPASNIVLRALEAPIRQIAENAGAEGSLVVGNVLANKSQTYGFDAQTEQYVDMLEAGIVDPAKVVRVALQDAASVAGLMITTEAMVAEHPKKEAPTMPGGGGMGGMDY